MAYLCPKCQSDQIAAHDYAKRICAFVGTIAGVLSAVGGMSVRTTRIGNHPLFGIGAGVVVGKTAGTIIDAMIVGMAGGAAGAKLGEFLDTNVLRNFQCHDCGHKFSAEQAVFDDNGEFEDQHHSTRR